MGRELRRVQRRRETANRLDRIMETAKDCLVVHYSCESFYDRQDGRTPRVTSIAVRNFGSGQTESFSIHKIAEQRGIHAEQVPEQYDQLELQMLDDFFSFLRANQGFLWLHWNMRDINFGFQALEHRHKVLGGEPFVLPESKRF